MDKHEKNKILTRTRRRFAESNTTMPPEEMRGWNGNNGGVTISSTPNELESSFRIRVERSCWINNNENDKLVMGL